MKRKLTLNEELNRMKGLMSYENGQYKNPIIDEQTRIGTKKKNLEIYWGQGKTINLRKGKSSQEQLAQGETKPTKPEEEWDEFLKGDKKNAEAACAM